jgi:hypothetical protein
MADNLSMVRGILGRDDGGGVPPTPNPALGGPGTTPPGPPMAGDGDGDEKITGEQAGYVPDGLNCGNCDAFLGDGVPCAKVSEPVAASGFCRVHSELVGNANAQAAPPPMEAGGPGPEEEPGEEPGPEEEPEE